MKYRTPPPVLSLSLAGAPYVYVTLDGFIGALNLTCPVSSGNMMMRNGAITSATLDLQGEGAATDISGNTVIMSLTLTIGRAFGGGPTPTLNANNCAGFSALSVTIRAGCASTINLVNSNLTAAQVNTVLAAAVASGRTTGTLALHGTTNAAPTGQGLTDYTTLTTGGNSWTISKN